MGRTGIEYEGGGRALGSALGMQKFIGPEDMELLRIIVTVKGKDILVSRNQVQRANSFTKMYLTTLLQKAKVLVSLFPCMNNMSNIASFTKLCHTHSILSQGDIKPLLQHLDFRARFRRRDMVGSVDFFHRKRSRLAPHSITEYRPREANAIADHLAGEASSYLLALLGEENDDLGDNLDDFSILCDPPYELLLRENAIIAGPHQGRKSCSHFD